MSPVLYKAGTYRARPLTDGIPNISPKVIPILRIDLKNNLE